MPFICIILPVLAVTVRAGDTVVVLLISVNEQFLLIQWGRAAVKPRERSSSTR